jgi:hypothetical protein
MFEHKPKATKTHLKKVQELKELLQAQLDAGTTTRFRSVDQPLEAGEVRNSRYKPLVENSQLTEEEMEKTRKQLEEVEAEEKRVMKELDLS